MKMFLAIILIVIHAPNVVAESPAKRTLPQQLTVYKAPDFTLKGEDGKIYKLSNYKGKVVILNFWATWCPPCRYEMPAMERAWNKLKGKGVVLLAINVGEDADAIFEFTGKYNVTFPLLMDQKGEVVKKYPVTGLPTTYIINPQGMVTHRAMGGRPWDHPALIKRLLDMTIKSKTK